VKGRHHIDGLEDAQGSRGHTHSGVVVDHVEDLDLFAVGQHDVGNVHLPALVGQIGLEADVRALGALVGLGCDEAPGFEYPPDGGDRGDLAPTVRPTQMDLDRLGPGVKASLGQFLSETDDLVLVDVGDFGGRVMGPLRARHQAGVAFGRIAGQQFIEPGLRDAMITGHLSDGLAFDQDCRHQIRRHLHRATSSRCPRCLATCVRYLLNSHTSAPTELANIL
jgi:hypothetical protein